MSASDENKEDTLCGGSMPRKLKLDDFWEVSHSSLPAWVTLAPCTAPWFPQTNSVRIKMPWWRITAHVSPCLGSLTGARKILVVRDCYP